MSYQNSQQMDMFQEGKKLKTEGIERVLKNSNSDWRTRVRCLIQNLAKERDEFTSDDVREEAIRLEIGDPHHLNAWGAAMSALAKEGVIKRIGYVQSKRPVAHATVIGVWKSAQKV